LGRAVSFGHASGGLDLPGGAPSHHLPGGLITLGAVPAPLTRGYVDSLFLSPLFGL